MLTKNINFINFKIKKKKIKKNVKKKSLHKENNAVIQSFRSTYRDSYNKKNFKSLNKKFIIEL